VQKRKTPFANVKHCQQSFLFLERAWWFTIDVKKTFSSVMVVVGRWWQWVPCLVGETAAAATTCCTTCGEIAC
jgi:hypothetical protein